MSEYVFLFDLDATITKVEILPEIARAINKEKEMRELTELTMQGEIPFERSFLERIELLKDIPVTEVAHMVRDIPVNDKLVALGLDVTKAEIARYDYQVPVFPNTGDAVIRAYDTNEKIYNLYMTGLTAEQKQMVFRGIFSGFLA